MNKIDTHHHSLQITSKWC